jgi:hypothetical protein
MRCQLSQLNETKNKNQSISLPPSFPPFLTPSSKIRRLCLQLAKTMQPAGQSSPDPHSPMACLTSPFHREPLHLFSFFLEFSFVFCYLLLICLIACTRRLLRSKFLKLVTEYNNGEVYDRFKQILQDYIEQRFFLSSAFSFMLK